MNHANWILMQMHIQSSHVSLVVWFPHLWPQQGTIKSRTKFAPFGKIDMIFHTSQSFASNCIDMFFLINPSTTCS